MGSKFLFERPTSLRGPRVRVFDKDGEPFFVTGIRLQKILPIDDMLERIIERHRLSLSDGEASDTEAFEKDVLGYIADLDMNELDSVEDEWEDGLYIDAKDPIYYKIVKDGKTLLAFEPLGDEDDRNEMNDALTFFDDGDEDEEE